EREKMIDTALRRAVDQLKNRNVDSQGTTQVLTPIRWCSVIPFFPWRDLCQPEVCYQLHRQISNSRIRQRMPGGSFSFHSPVLGLPQARAVSSLTATGHCFFAELAWEAMPHFDQPRARVAAGQPAGHRYWLEYDDVVRFLTESLTGARGFYEHAR